MGFRKPHPINCLAQNNYCSKSIDCDANGCCEKQNAQSVYRKRVTGFNGGNCGRRQCISWANFCRSIRLSTFALLLLNANVIAAEPQQNQQQQSTPCEARVLEELPPDPVNIHDTMRLHLALDNSVYFSISFRYFQWKFDSYERELPRTKPLLNLQSKWENSYLLYSTSK